MQVGTRKQTSKSFQTAMPTPRNLQPDKNFPVRSFQTVMLLISEHDERKIKPF
jgi:hypothetical protein